jgi:hypothetical protein
MTTTLPQTSTGTKDLVAIDALGPAGEYRTRNGEVITDTAGVPVAELSIVPPLYVTRTIGAQRKLRPLPVAQRQAALAKTAEIFANSVITGLTFDHYVQLASRVSGLPIAVTRAGAQAVAEALTTAFDSVRPAQPAGAALDWREERTRYRVRIPSSARRTSFLRRGGSPGRSIASPADLDIEQAAAGGATRAAARRAGGGRACVGRADPP